MNQQPDWIREAVFYHIYPLGFCGAPRRNLFTGEPVDRLTKVKDWIPHLLELGVNALYLGPLFESGAHGYDTADYYMVDRRLGDRQALKQLSGELQRNGIRLILDGVFNHVGRDFWAFRDVLEKREASAYIDWFSGLRFDARSPYGDPFTYESWSGHYDLVRLNLRNPAVRDHLFAAIRMWMTEFNLSGLRLDVADCLEPDFIRLLRKFTIGLKSDFWLMGEVIHGDYRRWANPEMLHSVTNYECYKGLYSSLTDRNYFEIAWSLNRQFGPEGMYRGIPLYNFADNHDVDRVASSLRDPVNLYPLYLLLFTMPGVPSIYYGSEWGLEAKRTAERDEMLRPELDLSALEATSPQPNLPGDIARLAALRKSLPALRDGGYRQLSVAHEQLAFARMTDQQTVVVLLNAADTAHAMSVPVPEGFSGGIDRLNGGQRFPVRDGMLCVDAVSAGWGRVVELNH